MTTHNIAVSALKNKAGKIVKEAREELLLLYLDANDLHLSQDSEARQALKDAIDGLTKAWKALP